jgi:hypothetical protein
LIALYQENQGFASERAAAAYVAVMGERGMYSQALANLAAFRSSRSRTYLTAPYFNSLVEMDRSLTTQMNTSLRAIEAAPEQRNLALFTALDLGDYLLREPDSRAVTGFLAFPAALEEFSPTTPEAAGIVDVYSALSQGNREYAALLEPVIGACLAQIASSCALTGDALWVYGAEMPEAGESLGDPLPPAQAAAVGAALINYGARKDQNALKSAGYLIVNSALSGAPPLDALALGELYPRLARANTFYPHSTLLATQRGAKVWAWNAARSISYTADASGDVTIGIDFPQENTHHIILRGVEPFNSIYIYDVPYRTDPRFEAYNSSGYVYNAGAKTLLLKVRHKTQREIIRLIYSQ